MIERLIFHIKARFIRVPRLLLKKFYFCFPQLLLTVEREIQKLRGIGFSGPNAQFEAETVFKFLPNPTNKDLVVLDVGAHIGSFVNAILEINPHAKIIAFEPSAKSFQILEATFKENANVSCYQLALDSTVSYQRLFFDKPGSELSSLSRRSNLGFAFDGAAYVEVSSIDVICQKYNLEPSLIKIDTEGNELEVLKGAIQTLKLFKPIIQFEFGGTAIDSRTFFVDYWEFLSQLDYSIYRITPLGPIRIKTYSEREEVFVFMNLIASTDR